MRETSFLVTGSPAPQGSKTVSPHGGMWESSKAVKPWRDAVRGETQRIITDPFAGAVRVSLVFRMKRPKGHYRTGRNSELLRDAAPAYPASKPDVDKLARAVLDGLTEGGAWKDDGQVVYLTAVKKYAFPTGCLITVSEMEEGHW